MVGMFKVRSKDNFSVSGKAWTSAGSVEDVEGFSLLDMHFLCYFRSCRQRLRRKE
jgi:hypothetical protein